MQRMRRRGLMLGAMAIAAGALCGCSRVSSSGSEVPAIRTKPLPTTLGIVWPTPPSSILADVPAAFARDNPGYAITYSGDQSKGWWLGQASNISLTAVLKELNVDPAVLLPSINAAFSAPGSITMLPTRMAPLVVRYSAAAFAIAGAKLPTPDWDYDDFLEACAAVAAAIKAGRLGKIGVKWVLPRMIQTSRNFEDLDMGGTSVWGAFVLGFGGNMVENGQVVLDRDGSARGLNALVDLVLNYGGSPGAPDAGGWILPPGVALCFQELPITGFPPGPTNPDSASGQLARFPKLPVYPVVTGDLQPRALVREPETPGDVPVPADLLLAAGKYIVWRYQLAQQQLFASAGIAPVVNDSALQESFWMRYGMSISPADFAFPAYTWSPYLQAAASGGADLLGFFDEIVADPLRIPGALQAMAQSIRAGLATQAAR